MFNNLVKKAMLIAKRIKNTSMIQNILHLQLNSCFASQELEQTYQFLPYILLQERDRLKVDRSFTLPKKIQKLYIILNFGMM